MRRSAALRYAGSWAVANAVLFTVSLLFLREGHLGDASIFLVAYLYLIQLLLGGAAGICFYAAAALFGIENASPGLAAPKAISVYLFRFGCAFLGFGWLWILTGLQQQPQLIQMLCAAGLACLASIISVRGPELSISD
ncbi:unannotated protein [freshwater metagenome]|uniref:Unannotated protein n=1 Tax=freshwater metagenome TaxID=449393 RepID=A0A6J6JH28_9ZZZZ